jgi:AcrR family transcriptional regulator
MPLSNLPRSAPASASTSSPDRNGTVATVTTVATSVTRQRNARGAGNRLRVDLLEAAADLMAEQGTVDAASLRAVARRAGVSATAVYRHFDDHVQLVQESVRHCWNSFLGVLESARDAGLDTFQAFELCGTGYASFALEHPGQYRVMFSNRIEIEGETSLVANATFQILIDLVEAILDELGDDRDPLTVAVQVHTWIHGIVDLNSARPDVEWPSIDAQLLGLSTALGLCRPTV